MLKTKLRLRPSMIRFFILGISDTDVTVSSAHKSLELAVSKGVHTLYIADILANQVIRESDPQKFLDWWAEHYEDKVAEYKN